MAEKNAKALKERFEVISCRKGKSGRGKENIRHCPKVFSTEKRKNVAITEKIAVWGRYGKRVGGDEKSCSPTNYRKKMPGGRSGKCKNV